MTSLDRFTKGEGGFATHDIDFFLGQNYLVTVHDGQLRSVEEIREHCPGDHTILGDGPVAPPHRIVDLTVERCLPEVDQLEDWVR